MSRMNSFQTPQPAGQRSITAMRLKPEGPYETADVPRLFVPSNHRMAQFIDFVEQQEEETRRTLSIKQGYSEIQLLAHLLRNHLSGKMTTSSSLAGNSGLTYGTAIRAIEDIIKRGLIVKRPRTATGKSFSLHPTHKLLTEWQELARRTRSLIDTTIGFENDQNAAPTNYYFGSSYATGETLAPPGVLDTRLVISGSLRILVHADPTFMAMNVLRKQFESEFGVSIKSRALSIDRLRDEILNNAKRKTSDYDLIACDLPWFGELAQKGALLSLDSMMDPNSRDIRDIHPVAMASARYQGRQYGLPVQTTPELLVYRRDIFADAGINPPDTIEQTLAAAKSLHDPFSGLSGMAWNAGRGTPLGHSFLFVMAAFGQAVINLRHVGAGFDGENVSGEEFRPMFNSDAALQTAAYFKELLQYSARGILTMSWFERAQCFADGKCAMAYCATLLSPLFETESSSPAYGNTGYLPHPHGPAGSPIAPIGGYAVAIPSNIAPERINSIWTALTSITSAPAIKLYIENGSLVSPRFSVSMDPEVKAISPLISIVDEMARFETLQMWPRPPVPEITEIIAIAGEEIHDMLSGAKSIKQALENSQNRADTLMRANGHY